MTAPAAFGVPLLILGGDDAARTAVAARLHAIGLRLPPAAAAAAARLPELHRAHAAAAAGDDPARRAVRSEAMRWLAGPLRGGHGVIVADRDLARAMELWRGLADAAGVAPALLVLTDAPDDAPARDRAMAQAGDMPRIVLSRAEALAAGAGTWGAALAALGLDLPRAVLAEAPDPPLPAPADLPPDPGWAGLRLGSGA